jgi:predicted RND superfamily exporter protein
MKKFSHFIIENRIGIFIIISLTTLVFAYQVKDLKVSTNFADLLPQGHEYIKLHNRIRSQFGGANSVVMVLQVREGDIFTPQTLQKIRDITDELYFIPAVDRFKITSIALKKMMLMEAISGGSRAVPLMWPEVPKTQEEATELREKIYGSFFYGSFVWFDCKKTLITADFFEDEIDYSVVFKALRRLQDTYEDSNHILSIHGEPMHLGYVDSYVGDVLRIMLITLLVLLFLFYYWYRSVRATVLPVLAAFVSGVWGLGLMGFLGYNLDPLILVFPFLVASRAACHTVQVIKRYTEECLIVKEGKRACERVIESMFKPGFTAITTDAMGIILIALTPIQILQKITIACTFWCIAQVIIAMIFVPILLSFLPISSNLLKKFERKGVLDRMLSKAGSLMGGRGSLVVFAMVPVLIILGYLGAKDIQVGDAMPGSSLLWPWHRYNRDGFRIAFSMPIVSPLFVVMEGKEEDDLLSCWKKPRRMCADNLRDMFQFERFMRETPGKLVMFTQSIISRSAGGGWFAHEGDPNWFFFPTNDKILIASYKRFIMSSEPGTADKYVDEYDKSANIIIYCRDKTTQTIKTVIARINEYTNTHAKLAPPLKYKLAGGAVGVQAAINDVIQEYHWKTLGWALLAIFLICWVMFRSIVAALILTIPLIISNLIAFSMMATGIFYLLPVPITITLSTLPVAAVGIGLGVDYGIYMLGRIQEEYKVSRDLKGSIEMAMISVGEPVVFTALAMTAGLVVWVFSPLMFQATMGFFLATILLLNMLSGLFLVPSFVAILQPGFLTAGSSAIFPVMFSHKKEVSPAQGTAVKKHLHLTENYSKKVDPSIQTKGSVLLKKSLEHKMGFARNSRDFFRRLSPFKLFLLITSPFAFSLLIHAIILILSAYTTWYVTINNEIEEPAATIVFEDRTSDRFSFQDTNTLKQIKVNSSLAYTFPQVEYRPVVPDVTFYPEPTNLEELDLIGVETIDREWLNPVTDQKLIYSGEEKLAGSFSRHIQSLRKGGLDIVFVFDSTSSMAEFLKQVKSKITNLVVTFKQLVPTARIGLITYRDKGDEFITKKHPLTYGTKSLQLFLRDIDPVGGGDREEAVDEALRVAIEEFKWREHSKKIILVIGDAPPHQEDMPTVKKLIGKFKDEMNGMVAALDTSRLAFIPVGNKVQQDVLDEFKLIAQIGGGESARLIDEEKVIRQMVVLVFGTRWEVFLDEFMKNL